MSEAAETETSPGARAPFAAVTPQVLARDVLAVVALLVALPMPWDGEHRGTDRLEVVLVTILAVLALAAPYALRGGLLPESWERVTTARGRVLGCAPYLVVVLVYLVLDATRSGESAGLVGGGVALGLAGAVLGASPRWPHALALAAGLVAVLALATPVLAAVRGEEWSVILGAGLNALLVVGVLALTAGALVRRGDAVGGIVLVAIGAVVALELVLLGGGTERPWFESIHGQRFGLLLLPVVAAFAVPRVVVEHLGFAHRADDDARAARWVAVAVRAFDVVLLVAGFVALVAILQTAAGGVAVNLVLRIVFGVLLALVAVIARRALTRDPRGGHVTAVGAACVLVVLGLVIVVARAGVGTRSNLEELLVTFGLPAIVLLSLLVPPPVRALAASPAPEPAGAAQLPAAASQEPAAQTTGSWHLTVPGAGRPWQQRQQPQQQPGAGASGGARAPGDATQVLPPVGQQPVAPQAQPTYGQQAQPASQQAGPQRQAWPEAEQVRRDAAQDADATQTFPAARPDARPDAGTGGGRDAGATQALPPAVDVPGSRWTAAQALDPTTPLADLALIVQESPHLRPHVAANPSTYPALLDWLGTLGDPAVDAALRSRR
jgi:hypothetical protein